MDLDAILAKAGAGPAPAAGDNMDLDAILAKAGGAPAPAAPARPSGRAAARDITEGIDEEADAAAPAPAPLSMAQRARIALLGRGPVTDTLKTWAQPAVNIWDSASRADQAVRSAAMHPVDTVNAVRANPGANFRELMRGINSNVPGANTLVEKLDALRAAHGGPAAPNPEADAAAALPGIQDVGGFAGFPLASAAGGIAAKGVEAGVSLLKAVGEGAQARQIERTAEKLETKVNKGTRAGMRSDAVANAIADSPELRAAAGNDVNVAKVTKVMADRASAELAPIYANSGPADEAVAKAVSNVDRRIDALKAGDVNQRAAAAKLQKIRDEFNDSFGGRESTTARELRDEQSAYQRNGYAKNINQDPDVSASILAQREMSKAVGDALVEHVTGMDYQAAQAAAKADPNSVAARLFKANETINAANKIDAGIADRAARAKPRESTAAKVYEAVKHPIATAASSVPRAAGAAATAVDDQLAKLAEARGIRAPGRGIPTPVLSEAASWVPDATKQRPTSAPTAAKAAAVARLLQMARGGASRDQLAAQAQQSGVEPEIAANIAMQFGR